MNELDDLIESLAPVVSAFRSLNVAHYIGGSVASSFHGATRSTMDVDVICDLSEVVVPQLLESIGGDYYASEPAIRNAIQRQGCFNLVHLPSSFKVDVFVSRGRPFDHDAMRRASMVHLGGSRSLDVRIATVEDTLISKLEWYRLGDEVSERQWEDVSRLMKLHGDLLDRSYLDRAARSIGVEDLLKRLVNSQ